MSGRSDDLAVGRTGAGAGVHAPRLLMITPDFPPAPGGIQVMAHELARELRGFEIRVLAPTCAGAREFDARSGVAVRRVAAKHLPTRVSNLQLNVGAVLEARRFRPA